MLGFDSQRKNVSNLASMDTHNHFSNMASLGILQEKGYIKKQMNESKIRFSTWNIGTLRGKAWEVIGIER